FLHELLFHLAGGSSTRTVQPGDPLLLGVPDNFQHDQFVIIGPGGLRFELDPPDSNTRRLARMSDTLLPGHYTLLPRQGATTTTRAPEHFVVTSDPAESQLDRLDESARGRLARDGRIDFVADLDQLRDAINKSAPRTEVWHLVLLGFLTLLIGEVLLTRRMVRGGYQQETPSS
ncbi:MAG: hypothetical protein VB861_03100, partial [Planctomycetaceae bacterium]